MKKRSEYYSAYNPRC